MSTQRNVHITFTFILFLSLILCNCDKKEKEDLLDKSVSIVEHQNALLDSTTAQIDYGSIMNQLFEIESRIKANPDDITIRREFMATAVDSARQKIYTVGEGLPDTTARSDAIAKQSAERAALADAQRWALFTLNWQKDVEIPIIPNKISGKVPPFKIVQKAQLLENKVYLLIEIDM